MAASSLTCTICVDDFDNSEDLCSTVCGHIFHFTCLQQWQERSNTCPLCNQRNPQPHRLFLDLGAIPKEDTNKDASNDNKINIKGIQSHLISEPLYSLVLKFAKIMLISIKESDIKNVEKEANNLLVTFFTEKHKNMFLENKFRLKGNQQTSGIDIHEILDDATKELFHYAHKLKQFNYKIIFVKNRKIFAKMTQNDEPIQVNSKEQVDSICGKNQKTKNNSLGNKTKAVPSNRSRNPTNQSRSTNAASSSSYQEQKNTANNSRCRNSNHSQNTSHNEAKNTTFTTRPSSTRCRTTNLSQNTSYNEARYTISNVRHSSSGEFRRDSQPTSTFTNTNTRNVPLTNQLLTPASNTARDSPIAVGLSYNEPSAPDSSLMDHMDGGSASLIRQLILEDTISSIPVYTETNSPSLYNRTELSSYQQQYNRGIGTNNNKGLKNTFKSMFRKITQTFK